MKKLFLKQGLSYTGKKQGRHDKDLTKFVGAILRYIGIDHNVGCCEPENKGAFKSTLADLAEGLTTISTMEDSLEIINNSITLDADIPLESAAGEVVDTITANTGIKDALVQLATALKTTEIQLDDAQISFNNQTLAMTIANDDQDGPELTFNLGDHVVKSINYDGGSALFLNHAGDTLFELEGFELEKLMSSTVQGADVRPGEPGLPGSPPASNELHFIDDTGQSLFSVTRSQLRDVAGVEDLPNNVRVQDGINPPDPKSLVIGFQDPADPANITDYWTITEADLRNTLGPKREVLVFNEVPTHMGHDEQDGNFREVRFVVPSYLNGSQLMNFYGAADEFIDDWEVSVEIKAAGDTSWTQVQNFEATDAVHTQPFSGIPLLQTGDIIACNVADLSASKGCTVSLEIKVPNL